MIGRADDAAILHPRHVIAVQDLRETARYFRDVLGFAIEEAGDPGWLFFRRDACFIMAGQCPDAPAVSELGDHSYIAYLEVRGIDALHAEIRGKGAELIKDLRDEPWGMREFGLRTPDGHRIMFGEPSARKE